MPQDAQPARLGHMHKADHLYRPLRDAPPVPVRLAWWRDDEHPATPAAVGLLTTLFRSL